MSNSPLVSIVVNNYNYAQYVGEAIESALAQTYPAVEVIVVDDGSTDASRTVISGFGDRITPLLKDNEGQASTFNAGFELSHGEVVMFLDADDYLLPHAAERAVAVLSTCDAVKVHWPLWEVTESGARSGRLHPRGKLATGCWRDHVVKHGPVSLSQSPTSGNAWRRSFLNEVLPIPEHEDKHGADGFLRKLAPLFGEMRTIGEPQGCYRVHPRSYGGGRGLLFRFRRALKRYPVYCQLAAEHLDRLGISTNTEAWRGPGSEYAWLRDAVALHDDIASLIPPDAGVVLVDDDSLGPDFLPERRVSPFLERDGQYWGPPRTAQHAMDELERMRRDGARFLLIAFPAFWWFDAYRQWRALLEHRYRRIFDGLRLVAFDLHPTA